MKKIILPEDSIFLTEEDTKNIEGGTIADMMGDIYLMTMNRILSMIGSAVFDPLDVINRFIRNLTSPYASSSIPIETNIADNQSNNRTSLF
ncbi:MAG: hypothetical protein FWC47_03465 [Oscillospiraceae bacterium]|nr:hypothetical protein [Oscillospiraceae bacterium]